MFFERPEAGRRAVLLHVNFKGPAPGEALDAVEECAELAMTAGVDVAQTISATRTAPHPRLFIGEGKLSEIETCLQDVNADLLLVNLLQYILPRFGFEPERLRLTWIEASDGVLLAEILLKMLEKIKTLGPSQANMKMVI